MTDRKLTTGLTMLAVISLATLTASACLAQQGGRQGERGRGGQLGMMGAMMYLERSWTAVTFQLDCTEEQIGQLMPTYRLELTTRDEAVKTAAENNDREAMMLAYTTCQTVLEAKLKEVLTLDQLTRLDELMRANMMGGRRGGGGGG